MALVADLIADLTAASEELDDLVADLDDAGWATDTPSPGWTIAHQIGHLNWTDRVSHVAATDTEAFNALMAEAINDPLNYVDAGAEERAACPPAQLLADWRADRAALAEALGKVPEGVKLPWFGPPMSATSMTTARLMETWAHGLDVADALGVVLPPADWIKGVVHIGVRTRDFAYVVNGRQAPQEPFRFEITAPSGELWEWGPADAENTVRAPAVDFCMLVTQRRAVDDLDLELTGTQAQDWAQIAQCFAGPPGGGRAPAANPKSNVEVHQQ